MSMCMYKIDLLRKGHKGLIRCFPRKEYAFGSSRAARTLY